jgi:hypothetical protein
MPARGKYIDELPKGNATYGFFPLWNPHSSLLMPIAQSSPAGITCDCVPAPPPVKMGGQCQNGARRQGFATPRQTPARPCLLCAVLTSSKLRRAAPAGTQSEPISVLTDDLKKQPQASRLPAAERKLIQCNRWKAALMTVDGPTKRRILLFSMRHDLRVQSAPLVRGSSRRIMTLRFRPAYIRLINRRDSSTTVISPAFSKTHLPSSTHKRVNWAEKPTRQIRGG